MRDTPTFEDVVKASERIAGMAVRTPLLFSPILSERLGGRVFVKAECLQRTGSFKFRGAWNAVQALGGEKLKGVVAVSSGNHAQGVAEAARLAGIPAVIVMPADAPRPKVERTARSGARIVFYDRRTEDRDAVVAKVAERESGFAFIHPFDNPHVIAGQGTVGLEIALDCAALGVEPNFVHVPCSGGGLAAGVALAVTERYPQAKVWVVEPAGFDDYGRSLAAGARQRNNATAGSVCDALMSPIPGEIGWEINRRRLAGAAAVSDAEALAATGFAYDELKLVVEPGGAVGLAVLLRGLRLEGRIAVVVLSGGNLDDSALAAGLAGYRSAAASTAEALSGRIAASG
jgi:threonine dehydratase